jgi:hypothetical protein
MRCSASTKAGSARHFDLEQIRSRLSILDVLRKHNIRVRHRNRADDTCKGRSGGTLGFTVSKWHCHRCQAGGDVFSLYMHLNGCTFADAVKELAAVAGIRAVEIDGRQLDEARKDRAGQAQAALEIKRGIRNLRLHYRNQVQCFEGILREMRELIDVSTTSEAERETCGSVINTALDELREFVAGYYLLAFGTQAEQEEFFRDPGRRNAAVAGVLSRGIIRDDRGHVMEVSLP